MSRLEDKIRQHGKSEGYSHAHWYRLKLKANKQQWPCMQIGGDCHATLHASKYLKFEIHYCHI